MRRTFTCRSSAWAPPPKARCTWTPPPAENLRAIADALHRAVSDLTVVVLDRPRHDKLIDDIRQAGARIHLIGDGDLSAAISAAVSGTGVHAVMGIGGAPEGVLSAAALKCLGGEIQGRLIVDTNTASREKAEAMGVDFNRIYKTDELAPGEHIIFAACGVTQGNLLNGVHLFGDGMRTSSLILNRNPRPGPCRRRSRSWLVPTGWRRSGTLPEWEAAPHRPSGPSPGPAQTA
jgi:fructose-1,6-bisphosphatase II